MTEEITSLAYSHTVTNRQSEFAPTSPDSKSGDLLNPLCRVEMKQVQVCSLQDQEMREGGLQRGKLNFFPRQNWPKTIIRLHVYRKRYPNKPGFLPSFLVSTFLANISRPLQLLCLPWLPSPDQPWGLKIYLQLKAEHQMDPSQGSHNTQKSTKIT